MNYRWAIKCPSQHLVGKQIGPVRVALYAGKRGGVRRFADVDGSLVAVMMPFDAQFDLVYAALQGAATGMRMTCQRGDDIWDQDHIIQDVVSLIRKA